MDLSFFKSGTVSKETVGHLNLQSLIHTYQNHSFKELNLYLRANTQEGHDGPVSLHWLIGKIPSYQTLQYMGIGLKHETPKKD